ncbi:MAG: 1-acyl-sn-glycerol-3-phosphate acyltransferase [Leptospirales bacterium]|nr:1-acyl-sn-glycerol-3-phosphate acyltransferase [Leptospirales bacterium]
MAVRSQNSIYVLLRSLLVWALMVLWTLIIGILLLPFMILRIGAVIHFTGHYWARLGLWMAGMRVHVENPEKLWRGGPTIFISNHQSMLDILVFFRELRLPFAWMAKASLFKIPIIGWGMSAAGYIPVERGNREKSLGSLYKAADKVREGQSVIVFPEGTRGHPDGTMHAFKKGGFILAKRAGVVIQPLTISGAAALMPPKQKVSLQRVYAGDIYLVIHDPILPEEYADASVEDLMQQIRAIVERPLDRLRQIAAALAR